MRGTLLLDTDGDLLLSEAEPGRSSIATAYGSEQVAQAAMLAVSTRSGSAWFNLGRGLDTDTLFYKSNHSDTYMEPMRAQAYREAILAVEGIDGFADDDTITFTRTGRDIRAKIPCVKIDCDHARATISPIG